MTNPDQIWAEAVRVLERGKPFVLATVVNVRGSTPREVGAKMIVRDDGQFGTIGGGCGEAEVFRKARVLLEERSEARLAEVDLTGRFRSAGNRHLRRHHGCLHRSMGARVRPADREEARRCGRAQPSGSAADGGRSGFTRQSRVGSRTVVDPAQRDACALAASRPRGVRARPGCGTRRRFACRAWSRSARAGCAIPRVSNPTARRASSSIRLRARSG